MIRLKCRGLKAMNNNLKNRSRRLLKDNYAFLKSDKLIKARIYMLKKRAKRLLISYDNECAQMSCGRALAEVVNPRALRAKVNFNKVYDELCKIDPTVPKNARL